MDWITVIGAFSLGATLGWTGYVVFAGQRDIKTLSALVGIIGGTVILGLFRAFSGEKLPHEVWFYPVGLLAGGLVSVANSVANAKKSAAILDKAKEIESAKNTIVTTIKTRKTKDGKSITMISFERLRELNPNRKWTDDFLQEVIQANPKELCHRTLKPRRPGIGLVNPDSHLASGSTTDPELEP
jgi:hypothetical protein